MLDRVEQEIAAVAARLIVEEGLDHGTAKRRAVEQLGLPSRTRLPDNQSMDAALREHLAVFCADTHPIELAALRHLACNWMGRLTDFQPHLTGAVWNGTATRLSDIWIQLFCDDPKAAEIALINQNVRFSVGRTRGITGREVDVLSVSTHSAELGESVGVHLVLYDLGDLRGAKRLDAQGRRVRGSLSELLALLALETGVEQAVDAAEGGLAEQPMHHVRRTALD